MPRQACAWQAPDESGAGRRDLARLREVPAQQLRVWQSITKANEAQPSLPARCGRDRSTISRWRSCDRRNRLDARPHAHGALANLPARGSTIVTSRLPIDLWFEVIGDPTLTDAILDRLVHNAHRLTLNGNSMRRKMSTMKPLDQGVAP